VPLIVCTADRPPELHHFGAPQTIEQTGLFGGALRWSVDPGVPDERARSTWRSLASRLVAEATAGPMGPGPVHANLAFREPLLATPGELPPGRRNGRPWHRVDPSEGCSARARSTPSPAFAPRGKGLDHRGRGRGRPETIRRLAASLGWPVLADPGREPGSRRAVLRRRSQPPMRCFASRASRASTFRRSSCDSASRGRRKLWPTG